MAAFWQELTKTKSSLWGGIRLEFHPHTAWWRDENRQSILFLRLWPKQRWPAPVSTSPSWSEATPWKSCPHVPQHSSVAEKFSKTRLSTELLKMCWNKERRQRFIFTLYVNGYIISKRLIKAQKWQKSHSPRWVTNLVFSSQQQWCWLHAGLKICRLSRTCALTAGTKEEEHTGKIKIYIFGVITIIIIISVSE